jgi:hypothetical protein
MTIQQRVHIIVDMQKGMQSATLAGEIICILKQIFGSCLRTGVA